MRPTKIDLTHVRQTEFGKFFLTQNTRPKKSVLCFWHVYFDCTAWLLSTFSYVFDVCLEVFSKVFVRSWSGLQFQVINGYTARILGVLLVLSQLWAETTKILSIKMAPELVHVFFSMGNPPFFHPKSHFHGLPVSQGRMGDILQQLVAIASIIHHYIMGLQWDKPSIPVQLFFPSTVCGGFLKMGVPWCPQIIQSLVHDLALKLIFEL